MKDNDSPQEVQPIIDVCYSNAESLLKAAKTVLSVEGLPNIAYHLATLSLEEIGKADLVSMQYSSRQKDNDDPSAGNKMDDHEKKLFVAIWGLTVERKVDQKTEIEKAQLLAKAIHNKRLKAMYTDASVPNPKDPKDLISKEEAQELIDLVDSFLGMGKPVMKTKLTKEEKETINWFFDALEDPEKKRLILGLSSRKKLVELGNSSTWITWLKVQFDEADKTAHEAMQQELKRQKPDVVEARKPKWKIKFRIYSRSHSIRPKPLNEWNKTVDWIKLYPGDKRKKELILEFTLPKALPIHGLWPEGFEMSSRMVVALNIASRGFFWWHVERQPDKFYERIDDLESKMQVRPQLNPRLDIGWPHQVLDMHTLSSTSLVLAALMRLGHKMVPSIQDYGLGLAVFSVIDMHLRVEGTAYKFFYEALQKAMQVFGDWGPSTSYDEAFLKFAQEILDENDAKQLLDFGKKTIAQTPDMKDLTLREVGIIKVLCDVYYWKNFQEIFEAK